MPAGTTAIGVPLPASPAAQAVTVPSPPHATTRSAPSATAVRACPWPGSSGVVASHIGSPHPRSAMAARTWPRNLATSSNFAGLMITAARLTGTRRALRPSSSRPGARVTP